MKHSISVLIGVLLISITARASDPTLAKYTDDPNKIVWFLVISDTHVGENQDGGDQDTVNLNWVLGEAYTHIKPAIIFNTGDLIDATNGGIIPTGPHNEEWTTYQNLLLDNNMTFDQYVDMPGNHDQYSDKGLKHYLKYSMGGQYDNQTQHNVIRDYEFGKYQFITTATCGNDGASWPWDHAGIDNGEKQFIINALEKDKDSSLSFVFGHHPLYRRSGIQHLLDNAMKDGDKFFKLLKQYHVLVYFYGHTHKYFTQWKDGVLLYNLASLGKSKDKHFVVFAIDNNSLAVRAFKARNWPYIVTTAPADKSMCGDNPYARPVPKGWDRAVVRALVFDVSAVRDVVFSIDDGKDQPMYRKYGPVWQGRFDATKLKSGEHTLKVKYKGNEHTTKFMIASYQCSDGIDNDNNGLTDFPDDPGCESPADNTEEGAAMPDGHAETGDDIVVAADIAETGVDDRGVTDQGADDQGLTDLVQDARVPDQGSDAGNTSADTGKVSDLPGIPMDSGLQDTGLTIEVSETRAQDAGDGAFGESGDSTDTAAPAKVAGGSCQCNQNPATPPYGEFLLFLALGLFLAIKRKA